MWLIELNWLWDEKRGETEEKRAVLCQNSETAEQREPQMETRRELSNVIYVGAVMSTQQPQMLLQQTKVRLQSENVVGSRPRCTKVPSPDDPFVVEFYNHLYGLSMVNCSIYSEEFPNIQVNSAGDCKHCATDKHIPKLYSALNNMDPS